MEATVIQHRRRMLEVTGSARVINISSSGLAFRTPDLRLQLAETVTLILEWPACLEDGCPLRLKTTARIVRMQDDGLIGAAILGHEIYTRSRAHRRARRA